MVSVYATLDNTAPEFLLKPPLKSPGRQRYPEFLIRSLPTPPVSLRLFRGPLPDSQCGDSSLIDIGTYNATQRSYEINDLSDGDVPDRDGKYRFFVKVIDSGGNQRSCLNLDYILDRTSPNIVAGTSQNPLENDDTLRNSKTWSWACRDQVSSTCTYRHRIDTTALTGTSCARYTFNTESYGSVSTATKTGGNGKYCIHVQAKDEAGNESPVVSVYATLDNTGPGISGVSVPTKTYKGGDQMDVTVTFSEPVTVTGVPRLALTFDGGGQSQTKYATYESGSGSSHLIFRYIIQGTDSDTDGIGMRNSVDLNSGTLKDIVGNAVNPLTFTVPTNLSSVRVEGSAPNVVLSKTDLEVSENGGVGTYTLKLNKAPSHPVTVTLESGDTSIATVSSNTDTDSSSTTVTLRFESDNTNNKIWSTPQTVTVTGVNDNEDNDVGGSPKRSTNISHRASSSDTEYNSLTVNSVEVRSLDDDEVGSVRLTLKKTSTGTYSDSLSLDEHDSSSSLGQADNTESIGVKVEFHGSRSGGQSSSSVSLSEELVVSVSVGLGTAQVVDFNAVTDFKIRIPSVHPVGREL